MATTRQSLARLPVSDVHLRYLAAGLAYLVAVIHLFHPDRGFPRLMMILDAGKPSLLMYDPRPIAFVLSGLAIITAVKLVLIGVSRRPIYALGIGLMLTYIIGYVTWHLTGHGGFLPLREPLYHGMHPVAATVTHLVEYPWERAAKLTEVALLAVLVVLYRREAQ